MAQRHQSSDDIADEIKKQQGMYDDTTDDTNEPVDIDKAVEEITGDAPRADDESDFLAKQIDDDDKKHGDIPPEGSDAENQE